MAFKKDNFIQAVGRRKTASARVRITLGGKPDIIVNDKDVSKYFPQADLNILIKEPLVISNLTTIGTITVKVIGGGVRSQAEAIRLGVARAILFHDPILKSQLRAAGLLKRDPREKERKKPGLKRARKAPQWSKR